MKKMIKNIFLFCLACAVSTFVAACGGGGGGGSAGPVPPPATDVSKYQINTTVPYLVFDAPTVSGTDVVFPLKLATLGKSITALDADIGFDALAYALKMNGAVPTSATVGAAATAAGKQISQSKSSTQPSVLHIAVVDLGGQQPIADGVIAQIRFSLVQGTMPGNYGFVVVPTATDGSNPAAIYGTGP